MAWRNLRRLDQRHVGRTHVAVRLRLLALVEAGYVAERDLDNFGRCSQMRTRHRICGPGASVVAGGSQPPTLRPKTLIIFGAVLLGCGLFAASDEFHQMFVKSRTPSIRDVFLDVGGALLGLLIGATFARRHPKKFQSAAVRQFVECEIVTLA